MPGVWWLLGSFWELSTDRQSGFGVGHIPFASIVKYCDEVGIFDREQRSFFRNAMREADTAFVKYCNAQKGDGDTQVSDVALTDDDLVKMLGG